MALSVSQTELWPLPQGKVTTNHWLRTTKLSNRLNLLTGKYSDSPSISQYSKKYQGSHKILLRIKIGLKKHWMGGQYSLDVVLDVWNPVKSISSIYTRSIYKILLLTPNTAGFCFNYWYYTKISSVFSSKSENVFFSWLSITLRASNVVISYFNEKIKILQSTAMPCCVLSFPLCKVSVMILIDRIRSEYDKWHPVL